MKVKVIERSYKEVETDIELPVYLYFQDELCNDQLVAITDEGRLEIKFTYGSLIIEKSAVKAVEEHHLKNNLTTKEHFMEVYREALRNISKVN